MAKGFSKHLSIVSFLTIVVILVATTCFIFNSCSCQAMKTMKAQENFYAGAVDYYPDEIGTNQDYIEGNLTVTGSTAIGKSFLPTSEGNIEIIPSAQKDGKIKIGDDNTSHIQLGSPQTKVSLGKVENVSASKMTADKLNLGNKWQLSGVGDAHANDDWLRVFNKDGTGYYGGVAAGKLWVGNEGTTTFSGNTEFQGSQTNFTGKTNFTNKTGFSGPTQFTGDATFEGGLTEFKSRETTFKGGKSEHNPGNWNTHFPWAGDGTNYIRGDTELRGNIDVKGNATVGKNINVSGTTKVSKDMVLGGKFFIGATGADTNWNWNENGSDAYWIEKINNNGNGNSSTLRLTMNDDADEAFEIYGDSCRVGSQCKGEGARKHYFGVDGTAMHTGQICVNGQCLNENDIRKLKTKI